MLSRHCPFLKLRNLASGSFPTFAASTNSRRPATFHSPSTVEALFRSREPHSRTCGPLIGVGNLSFSTATAYDASNLQSLGAIGHGTFVPFGKKDVPATPSCTLRLSHQPCSIRLQLFSNRRASDTVRRPNPSFSGRPTARRYSNVSRLYACLHSRRQPTQRLSLKWLSAKPPGGARLPRCPFTTSTSSNSDPFQQLENRQTPVRLARFVEHLL